MSSVYVPGLRLCVDCTIGVTRADNPLAAVRLFYGACVFFHETAGAVGHLGLP
jgi:hypothetical protein